MAELRELLEEMLRPLRVEYKTGCLNSAAVGGFDRYMQRIVREALENTDDGEPVAHLQRMLAIFQAYEPLDLRTRGQRLREVKRRLDAMLDDSPPAADEPVPAPPPEPARLEPVPQPRPRGQAEEQPPRHQERLDEAVQFVKGIGPQRARLLAKLGLEAVGDLLFHFPRRHEDRSRIEKVGSAPTDTLVTLQGVVRNVETLQPRRRGLTIFKAGITDGTGMLDLVWFNQPWLKDQIRQGQSLVCSGRIQFDKLGRRQIVQPNWEPLEQDGEALHTGRLVPIYNLTEGLTQTGVRRWIKQALDRYTALVPEVLPPAVREGHELVGRREAIRSFHFPESEEDRLLARRRLVFEEFFGLQVALAQRRHEYDHRGRGIAFNVDSDLARRLQDSLPFELTGAQRRVLEEIRADLAAPRPMNRLVQGDVGSGKTLVALSAMLTVVDNGYQAALMVPTEILAEQHHRVMRHWCEPLGVEVELLTARAGARERSKRGQRLRTGAAHLAVGTHALIQEGVDFDALGLVVIDEQHRFGVMQRRNLTVKGETPDVLVMTATPIPRTLALTVYGDLDTSTIDEMPPGRTPIRTIWAPLGKRREVYGEIKKRLREGRQAYAVCPLVEESEALAEVEAVTSLYEHLQEHFGSFQVGMVHGRLKSAEKDEVMRRLRAGEIDLLAATTVIEVGIDVPNATVMLIVNADRFGLAQLHQLRGRVGRGAHESECYLLTDARFNPRLVDDESGLQYRDARARMEFMVEYADGFKLAEADLELRGPGELGGTRQSGVMDLHVAHLVRDRLVLEEARHAARALIEHDPHLAAPEHAELARFVRSRFRERGQLAEVG